MCGHLLTPSLIFSVDGGWRAWSKWETCHQQGQDETCSCRNRNCDAPKPARNGADCIGSKTEVSYIVFKYNIPI